MELNINNSTKDFLTFFQEILSRLESQGSLDISSPIKSMNITDISDLQYLIESIFLKQNQIEEYIGKDGVHDIQENQQDLIKNLHVMSFAQIILYKTLPCPLEDNCPKRPREIAPSNQYTDDEFVCFFYHHDKDRRRISIPTKITEDFFYSANYCKTNDNANSLKYSLNYFESMFHPIYYKLFNCKRVSCNQDYYCPFVHHPIEKSIWDNRFKHFILKSRDSVTKKKLSRENNTNGQIKFQKPSRKDLNPIFYSPDQLSSGNNYQANGQYSKSDLSSPIIQTQITYGMDIIEKGLPSRLSTSRKDHIIYSMSKMSKDTLESANSKAKLSIDTNRSEYNDKSIPLSNVSSSPSDEITSSAETNASSDKDFAYCNERIWNDFGDLDDNEFMDNTNASRNIYYNPTINPYKQYQQQCQIDETNPSCYMKNFEKLNHRLSIYDDNKTPQNPKNQSGLNQFFNINMVQNINKLSLYRCHRY